MFLMQCSAWEHVRCSAKIANLHNLVFRLFFWTNIAFRDIYTYWHFKIRHECEHPVPMECSTQAKLVGCS